MEETKVVASEEAVAQEKAVAQEEAVAKEAEALVEQAEGEAEARESSDTVAMPPPQEIERMEEQKLKSKFPGAPGLAGGRPGLGGAGGHSAFLQKRLGKGQKFFDSGDYQMARQGGGARGPMRLPVLAQPTGAAHPTPETVPARKSSIIQGVAGQGGHQGLPMGQPLHNPAVAKLL